MENDQSRSYWRKEFLHVRSIFSKWKLKNLRYYQTSREFIFIQKPSATLHLRLLATFTYPIMTPL